MWSNVKIWIRKNFPLKFWIRENFSTLRIKSLCPDRWRCPPARVAQLGRVWSMGKLLTPGRACVRRASAFVSASGAGSMLQTLCRSIIGYKTSILCQIVFRLSSNLIASSSSRALISVIITYYLKLLEPFNCFYSCVLC